MTDPGHPSGPTEHGWNLLADAPNEIGAEDVEVRAIAEKKEETR